MKNLVDPSLRASDSVGLRSNSKFTCVITFRGLLMLIWRALFETNFETPWEEGEGPFFSRISRKSSLRKWHLSQEEVEIGGGFTKVWARAPQAEGTLKGLAGERNREEVSVAQGHEATEGGQG